MGLYFTPREAFILTTAFNLIRAFAEAILFSAKPILSISPSYRKCHSVENRSKLPALHPLPRLLQLQAMHSLPTFVGHV